MNVDATNSIVLPTRQTFLNHDGTVGLDKDSKKFATVSARGRLPRHDAILLTYSSGDPTTLYTALWTTLREEGDGVTI